MNEKNFILVFFFFRNILELTKLNVRDLLYELYMNNYMDNIIIQISKGTSNIFLFHLYLKNIFHSETEKLLSRTRRQFLKSFLNSFNDIYITIY